MNPEEKEKAMISTPAPPVLRRLPSPEKPLIPFMVQIILIIIFIIFLIVIGGLLVARLGYVPISP